MKSARPGYSATARRFLAMALRALRMKWLLPCLLLALALPAFAQTGTEAVNSPAAAERNVAGSVELSEGEVQVFDANKKPRAVVPGDKIHEGDSVVTGKDGELHLAMEDGGFIGVRPDTRMRFTRYQANGESTDTSVIGLLTGTVRSVTGWIGKYNMNGYQIRTPTAAVGVRGTDHETLVIPQGQGNDEAGTYDKVNIGGTTLTTKHGKIDIGPDRAGFASHRRGERPRLLAQVPRFFKPTRTEGVFQGKHEAIRKVIDQRRDERRKLWKEKADKQSAAMRERADKRQERAEENDRKRDGRPFADAEQRREQRQAEKQAQEAQERREERKRRQEERPDRADRPNRPQQQGDGAR